MERRKTTTSTAVKQRWLDANYQQFTVRIRPELFEEIKEYTELHNLSRSQFLAKALEKLKEG